MKKVLFCSFLFALLFILPGKIRAQFYSPYIYNNNALVNRALAHQRAKAAYNRKISGKKRGRKLIRRKVRRVSMLQSNEFNLRLEASSAKGVVIV